MSAEVMAEIHKIIRKYTNLSVKMTMSSNKDTHYTTISIKESTNSTAVKMKKRKSESRRRRDMERQKSFLARIAGSCDQDSAASVLSPPTTQRSISTATPRRLATPGRRLGSGTAGAGTEGEVVTTGEWRGAPGGVGTSPIPQIDGHGGGGRGDVLEESLDDHDEKELVEEERIQLQNCARYKMRHELRFGKICNDSYCNACKKDISFVDANFCINCKYKLCVICDRK